jgi:signal transduction histidine kinase
MNKSWFIAVVIGVTLIIGGSLLHAEEIDHGKYSDKANEVKNLVEMAAASFKSKGKDHTIKLLNLIRGPFSSDELYVFAFDLKGTNLAHPTYKTVRGKPAWDLKDTKGKLIVQEMVKLAKDPGSGWVEYWWKRHNETEPTLKRSYIMRVPGNDDVLVGAGYYVK